MPAGPDRDSVRRGPIQGAVARGEDPERWIAVVERLENGGAPELARVRDRGAAAVFRMDDGPEGPVYIKRHGERRLQHELRENRFTTPPGERCWEAAATLERCGVATPRVRASLQVVDGTYLRADYLMADGITAGPSYAALLGDGALVPAQRRTLLAELARLVAHLHVRGVFHNDLKPAHVFRLGDDALSLIDLEYLTRVDRRHPRRYEITRWGDLTTLLREFEPVTTAAERRALGETYKRAAGLPASEPLTMQYHWVHSSREAASTRTRRRRRGS